MSLLYRWLFPAVLIVLVILSGCASSTGAAGDAERGRKLFAGEQPFLSPDAPGCTVCHNVAAEAGPGIGPNLAGLANLAGSRVPGQSAEIYLRDSLLNTDAYLVEGYQEGIMYRGYAEILTPQEISDLVAYLLTLK
jgi:cytochrome c553